MSRERPESERREERRKERREGERGYQEPSESVGTKRAHGPNGWVRQEKRVGRGS